MDSQFRTIQPSSILVWGVPRIDYLKGYFSQRQTWTGLFLQCRISQTSGRPYAPFRSNDSGHPRGNLGTAALREFLLTNKDHSQKSLDLVVVISGKRFAGPLLVEESTEFNGRPSLGSRGLIQDHYKCQNLRLGGSGWATPDSGGLLFRVGWSLL